LIESKRRDIEKQVSDLAIAEAQAIGSQAEQKAQEADERAEKTAQENVELKASLSREAAESKARSEELRRQNLTTETTLESERSTRLQLEKSLAPRVLPYRIYVDETTNVDDLRVFGAMDVSLQYVRDAEAERTAANLKYLFEKAGWRVTSFSPSSENLADGVFIMGYVVPFKAPRRTKNKIHAST
jgi:multidrug efflux pump subunit AcrA (membrane-fusion protein)